MTPSVELQNISKTFGPVIANDRVNFTLFQGEIHAIVGGNGAGKSTLAKIIFGLLQPDSGSVKINGSPVVFKHPKEAISAQIGMVHQELLLLENKTVLENVILGSEPSRFGWILTKLAASKIQNIIDSYNIRLDLHKPIRDLSVGERQRVLIARLLYLNATILILDEPTSALTSMESDSIFSVLTSLKENGKSIIVISHKLPEVMKYADRVSVMRSGKMIASFKKSETDSGELSELISGRKLPPLATAAKAARKRKRSDSEKHMLDMHNIKCKWGLHPLRGITLSVQAGEILGILGVEGNGQTELETILSGRTDKYDGTIAINGKPGVTEARNANEFAYIPSHREANGIVSSFPVADNCLLGWQRNEQLGGRLFLDRMKINKFTQTIIMEYDIQTTCVAQDIRNLSGGNQQKVVLGREFSRKPKVLFACNPTRGVDINTAYFVHKQLLDLANIGCAIVLMLSDINEAIQICHRIAILYEGSISEVVNTDDVSENELEYFMLGGK